MKKVICNTPQEFHEQALSHPASVIRGRKLWYMEEVVAEFSPSSPSFDKDRGFDNPLKK